MLQLSNTPALYHERVQNNLQALHELRTEHPNRAALERYSGWGGLRDAIYNRRIYKQLLAYVSPSELQSLKSSTQDAYFTPPDLIDFIYQCVQRLGIQSPQRILEPSAGHGRFLASLPDKWKQAEITAVEIDALSCQFLRALYPNAEICHQGFETFHPDKPFDLIVGNPPYGQVFVQDEKHSDLAMFSIHHYFVAKCMRLLNDDGVLAMVLPRYFMDNKDKHVRHHIARAGGHLLAAFRLPYDLFDNASVTVDVVVFQKRKQSEVNPIWTDSRIISEGKRRSRINPYFVKNPTHILGKLIFRECYGRPEIQCERQYPNAVLWKKLAECLSKMQCPVIEPTSVETAIADAIALDGMTDTIQVYLQNRLAQLQQKHATIQAEIDALQSMLS